MSSHMKNYFLKEEREKVLPFWWFLRDAENKPLSRVFGHQKELNGATLLEFPCVSDQFDWQSHDMYQWFVKRAKRVILGKRIEFQES